MEMGFGETKGWDPNSRCLSCCGARLLCRWRECVVTGLIHFSMCERWLLVGWSEGGWMGFFFVEVMLFYDWWKESAGNLYCIVRVEDKEAWLFPKEEELWVLSVVCFIVDWRAVLCDLAWFVSTHLILLIVMAVIAICYRRRGTVVNRPFCE